MIIKDIEEDVTGENLITVVVRTSKKANIITKMLQALPVIKIYKFILIT